VEFVKLIEVDGLRKRNLRVNCPRNGCGKPLAEAAYLDGRWHLIGRPNRRNVNAPLTATEAIDNAPVLAFTGAEGIKQLRLMNRPKMQPSDDSAYSLPCRCGATPRLSLERLSDMATKARNAGAKSIQL
jgi:hypothetical protein